MRGSPTARYSYRPYTYYTQPRRIAGERFQWIIEERKRRRSAEVQASAGVYNEWRPVGYFVTPRGLEDTLLDMLLGILGGFAMVSFLLLAKHGYGKTRNK